MTSDVRRLQGHTTHTLVRRTDRTETPARAPKTEHITPPHTEHTIAPGTGGGGPLPLRASPTLETRAGARGRLSFETGAAQRAFTLQGQFSSGGGPQPRALDGRSGAVL